MLPVDLNVRHEIRSENKINRPVAKYLVSDGMQVTVLAPGAAGYPTADAMEGVQIYRLPYFYPARLQRLAYEGGGILANLRRTWRIRSASENQNHAAA